MKKMLMSATALVAAVSLLQPAFAQNAWLPTGGPPKDGFRAQSWWHYGDDDDYRNLSLQEKVQLLRQKVKYVFVMFQENSFDHYFGTFPGANGIFSTSGRYARQRDGELVQLQLGTRSVT